MTEALVAVPTQVELGTLRATTPTGLVAAASELAEALASVIDKQKLYVTLQGKRYVKCEGWTTCAALMGLTPREVSVVEKDGHYVATVEFARIAGGDAIARASAECGGPSEPMWHGRPPNARRSMALTRATSKAARLAFSWIVTLAGYEPTPAEEMEHEEKTPPKPAPAAKPMTPVAEMAKAVQAKGIDLDGEQTRIESISDTKVRMFKFKAGERKGQDGKLYVITLASGFEGTTFNEDLFTAASALVEAEPVKVGYKARRDRPDTFEVTSITPVSGGTGVQDSTPLFDDEIPPF